MGTALKQAHCQCVKIGKLAATQHSRHAAEWDKSMLADG